MFLTIHATAAIVIGEYVHNPIGTFAIGLVSHYVLDIIPHGDEQRWGEISNSGIAKLALFDHMALMFNIAMIYSFKPDFSLTAPMVFAIIGSLLPDYLMAFYRITSGYAKLIFQKIRRYIMPAETWHHFAHYNIIKYELPFKYGMMLQAATMAALWMII